MASFFDRLKASFSGSFRPEPVNDGLDVLDYDQTIALDAENLAEQGILDAYTNLLPTLRKYVDAPLEVIEHIDTDVATYEVESDGKTYRVWDVGAKNEDGWERATVAFFKLVNANLMQSPYQFYALYGGNDLQGIFLTKEQYELARAVLPKRSEWPWLPEDQPPHYGHPASQ
jgi:hypothetical protein